MWLLGGGARQWEFFHTAQERHNIYKGRVTLAKHSVWCAWWCGVQSLGILNLLLWLLLEEPQKLETPDCAEARLAVQLTEKMKRKERKTVVEMP